MFLLPNLEKLNNLFLRNKELHVLLNKEDRQIICKFLELTDIPFFFENLRSFLLLQEKNYSIEIIWRIHSKQIIDFSEFITSYRLDIDHIIKTLLSLLESNDELSQIILTDLIASLLLLLSGEPNHIFHKHLQVVQHFITQSSVLIIKNPDIWVYLNRLKCCPYLIKPTAKKMFKLMLKNMLATDINYHLDVAFEEYRQYKTPEATFKMLEMFLDNLDEDTYFSLIQNTIHQFCSKANWKIILSMVTVFVKIKPEKCHFLKVYLEQLFNKTLSNWLSKEDFAVCKAALLVFRHCCLNIGLWSEYSRWYTSYKVDVKTAKVFYALLIYLVPYELPAALAAHTNMNRHEADIEKVLNHFKRTGHIMRVVLEASVFRQKYFLGTFLKTLMKSHADDDNIRCQFIEQLNDMNKIPNSAYIKWKEERKSVYFS
ncbi:Fanconi anemia group A protein homolog isoform X2 [Daktulosphaira vitifoliae]|uniref:Fanconi anemia group A protein homolog isoform X2 n=1 Tax=Daktulosphaira vitifoliae TaxID=58002 RepID=UPI0021AA835D|nr:Fanconi anemia group A protein homolog isoform X2 [Daktulosphaira vitifoliae]